MTTYKGLPTRLTHVLETISLFKDDPLTLEKMLTLHLEMVFLEGRIAALVDRENLL